MRQFASLMVLLLFRAQLLRSLRPMAMSPPSASDLAVVVCRRACTAAAVQRRHGSGTTTRLRDQSAGDAWNDGTEAIAVADDAYHVPVLLNECCEYLAIKRDGVYVDCTLGGGGHTKEIIRRGGRVIGLDQDPDSIAKTSKELAEHISAERLEIVQTNFRFLERAVQSAHLARGQPVDGILMDLGISSHQIDEPSRGFAFGADGPLDMRMGQVRAGCQLPHMYARPLTSAHATNRA